MVSFISSFTHPEQYQAYYISDGIEQTINRKAAFSELLSSICDLHYSKTPVINNEALNRNEATSMARNSRNKIVAALLRSELEPNLGLTGTGQEVSIMRSTLLRTGVLKNENGNISVNLHPECNPRMADMLSEIEDCIVEARMSGKQSFSVLYERLCSPQNGISIRRELIPLYLAVVLHKYKQQVVVMDRFGQIALNADALSQINVHPENYSLEYLDWTPEKADYIQRLGAS